MADLSPVPEPEPVPTKWTAYVIPPIDETGTTRHCSDWSAHTGEGTTIILLDDGSFMAAWRRGRREDVS